MNAQRARRLVAVSAVGVLMAGGTAIGAAGTASAAVPTQVSNDFHRNCGYGGWWNDCDYDYDYGYGYGHRGDRGDFYRTNFDNVPVIVIVVG
ncbi:hypothetical protein [Streptomyces sp. NPDC001530]|uniref:hypothetical protein n=1 Tax=Streptomyces sp. NPDC001530 TaxID=3364582 RepID=UPI003689166A